MPGIIYAGHKISKFKVFHYKLLYWIIILSYPFKMPQKNSDMLNTEGDQEESYYEMG